MFRPAYRRSLALLFAGLLCVPTSHAEGGIEITNAWINEAPPGMNMMGGYLDIINHSSTDVVLTGADSPCFERIEFHVTEIKNGVSSMRKQDSINIPAGSDFSFSPGRYHLMLINNTRPLGAGDKVPLRFSFDRGQAVEIEAEITRGDPAVHRRH